MQHHSNNKHIGMILKNIHKRVVSELNKELMQFDITLMQKEVLMYIYYSQDEKDVFQKHIEEYFNSTNPTITGILNRLESKDLIKREISQMDGRYKKLTITEKGKLLIKKISELGPKKMEYKLTQKLTTVEKDELERLLSLVLEGLEELEDDK